MKGFIDRATSFLDRAPEIWKENVELVELNKRLLWFILLRFGVVALLVFLGLTKKFIIPEIAVPAITLIIIAVILFLLNIFYWFYYQWAITYNEFPHYMRMVGENIQVQIILDFLILGFIVYECGGLESPLIYFFLFHNTLSCLFFKRLVSFMHTMFSIVIILLIYFLPLFESIPKKHFIKPEIAVMTITAEYAEYYLAGVISLYLIAWYLISTITNSLKNQEKALQEKVQEMIDLAREKTRYMLVTTHELKAPFAAIQSYVNVALEGYAGELTEKLRDILFKIRARCDTLTQMITDMIQLANITSIKERPQEVVLARVDLCQSIVTILPRFKEVAAKKGVAIDTANLLMERHFVEANSDQLQILLNNVISNAVAYCYPDTKIRIRIEEDDYAVVLSVADQGMGIKKEHLTKVFLEHFRSERAVEVNPNSTGLGLTIAEQIMDIHHGRIWIESEEGKGTTVYMEFPKSHE